MKKIWKQLFWGCLLGMFLCTAIQAADKEILTIPENTTTIEQEAFVGSTAISKVMISKNVEYIGDKAFGDCTGIEEVYFGKNDNIKIEESSFDGCDNLKKIYAYPGTKGELFALSHGYQCELLEEGNPFYQQIFTLLQENGYKTSILQSGEFDAKRLIIKTKKNHLPDISQYHPVDIVRDGEEIFFVQFASVKETAECYSMLYRNSEIDFVEADCNVELLDGVSAQGVTDPDIWDPSDPMGIDIYSDFIKDNGAGNTTIAVVDSGVSSKAVYNHMIRQDGVNLVTDGQSFNSDPLMHGSMIAGIIRDCVGDAAVEILPIRVVSSNGVGNQTLIGVGIQYAIEHGADIINLSMNFKESSYVNYCIERAIKQGVTVVVAAGNDIKDIKNVFPANVSGVITVSGIGPNYQLTESNYGENISFCAPGKFIVSSAYPQIIRKGTSFSAPMIASILALVKLDPYHDMTDVIASCKDLGPEGKDSYYGYGLPQLSDLAYIAVKEIQFVKKVPTQMAVGKSTELSWQIVPERATDQTVEVKSSEESILKIETDETGKTYMKAVGPGTASVTVTANGGENISVSAKIRVVKSVTDINIVGVKERLALSRTLQLSAAYMPDDATVKECTWHTTNPNIAVISEGGLLTPVNTGTVGVYATAIDGYGAKSSVSLITIIDVPDAERVILSDADEQHDISSGNILLMPGQVLRLRASVFPEDAEQEVAWACNSQPVNCVRVENKGDVYSFSPGTAVVSATTENGIVARLNVTVAVLPSSVDISGKSPIEVGETMKVTATVLPENTTDKSVIWSSSNPKVATIDKEGNIKGLEKGTTTINAKCTADTSIQNSYLVTVKQPYTLCYNANGGVLSTESKKVYSGEAIGELPEVSRDYHNFKGWFTEAQGGTIVSDQTRFECSDSRTIYAQWEQKPVSDWVPRANMPAGAQIVNERTITKDSTNASEAGYIRTGDYWAETGSGNQPYASFPNGFDTNHEYYQNWMKGPYGSWDNGTTKRNVENKWEGYVYWHWMYDTNWANAVENRAINNCYGSGVKYFYKYFGAFASANGNYRNDTGYCNNKGIRNYIVTDRDISWSYCQGAKRWFRFDYYRSYYKDYQRHYTYKQDQVQYRNK